MDKLILLDAFALIYRAYYAMISSPRVNSKGLNTSAIYGFVNTLEDLLAHQNATHIGVVFDPEGKTFRHELDPEYKATRAAQPEPISLAIPYIQAILRAYRIPVLSVEGYEADDVIGTLAAKAEAEGFDVLMMTPDKDYGQLVTDHIRILRPGHGSDKAVVMGPREVADKWGLQNPAQVLDLLALMGDKSDNVPGCKGIGEKGAAKLLNQFGSIDNILAHTDELKGAIKTKIEQGRDDIIHSRTLVTIVRDVPIEVDFADFRIKEPDRDALIRIYEELEFRTFITRLRPQPRQADLFSQFEEQPVAAMPQPTSHKRLADTEHDYSFVNTDQQIDELIHILNVSPVIGFDTETTSLDTLDARLVGMSFATAEGKAYWVPVPQDDSEARRRVEIFRPIFEDKEKIIIGHNLKYDIMVMMNYDVELRGRLRDTMVAHYLVDPEMKHSLDYLAEVLLDYQTIHIEELIGPRGPKQKNMADLAPEQITDYAAEDADVALKLYNLLMPKLKEIDVVRLYEDVEMPLVSVLARMERTGVIIDNAALSEAANRLNAKLTEIEQQIRELAGADININSPRQIGELLFDKLRLDDKPRKTKTGQYVTDEETLNRLSHRHEVVRLILDYRENKKLLSTYIEALPKLVNKKTGRVHTSFNQTVTATGRLSSSNPNLQNIPIRYEQGREVRRAFTAGAGCRFVSADYSQVELRLMAHLSEDEHLTLAFANDGDVHSATAAKIFHVDPAAVTADMRRKAKTINFGIIYGMSVFGMSERLDISRGDAKNFIDQYFENFAGVKRYMDQAVARARELGYAETVMHRRRYLPDINSRNQNIRGFAERNAINAPIQGTAADIIKIAMVRIDSRLRREGMKAEMILQVHDELNFNCPENEVEQLKTILKQEMENAYPLRVPLRVEIGVGNNWLEAH